MSGFFGPSSASFPNRTFTNTLSNATGTTVIPIDGTLPQVTEGFEALSLTITPSSVTARIRVECKLKFSYSIASNWMAAALFINGGANAVDVSLFYVPAAGAGGEMSLVYEYVPGAVSVQTIAARLGPGAGGGTVSVNLITGIATTFGGVMKSSMVATEVAAS